MRPTLHAIPWLPLAGSAVSAGIAMWLIDPTGGDVRALVALRVAAFLLAAGAAFALDDPAAATLAGSPTALAVRRAHRVVAVGAVWGLLWGLAIGVAAVASPGTPTGGPTLEAAGMLTLALATAALAGPHLPEGRGGVIAAPTLMLAMLGVLIAQYLYPKGATLFAMSPATPEWDAARLRWVVLLAASFLALAAASFDPSHRRWGAE